VAFSCCPQARWVIAPKCNRYSSKGSTHRIEGGSEQSTKNLPEQSGALTQQVEQIFAVDPQRNPSLFNPRMKLEINPASVSYIPITSEGPAMTGDAKLPPQTARRISTRR